MFPRIKLKVLALGLALLFPLASSAGDPLWIDVRTAAEFTAGHVDEAVNIPYDEIAEGIGALCLLPQRAPFRDRKGHTGRPGILTGFQYWRPGRCFEEGRPGTRALTLAPKLRHGDAFQPFR